MTSFVEAQRRPGPGRLRHWVLAGLLPPTLIGAWTAWPTFAGDPSRDGSGLLLPGLVFVAAIVGGAVLAPFAPRFGGRVFLLGLVGLAATASWRLLCGLAFEHGLRACAERAEPLIVAIERFRSERGVAPDTLGELVPEYIAAIPGSGVSHAPGFDYERGADRPARGRPRTYELGVGWMEFVVQYHRLSFRPPDEPDDDRRGRELQGSRRGWRHCVD